MTSEAWVRDVYKQRARPGALLVTITPAGLSDAIRFTDWAGGLTVGTGPDAVFYNEASFNFSWGGAGDGEATRPSKLEVAAIGEVVQLVRLATGQPPCEIERVRVVSPGQAEKALRGRVITQAEVSGGTVKIDLTGTDLASEPACKASYTYSRTPGLY